MGEGEDLRSRLGKWTLSAYRRLQSGSDSSESICIHIHTHVYIYIMMHGKAVRTVPIPRMTRILPVVINKVTILIIFPVKVLITVLTKSHDPPSRP